MRLIRLLLAWLIGLFYQPAARVPWFKVEVHTYMKTARFSWDYPTQRQQGGALNPADIVGAEVALRVAGAPEFTVLATVDHPTDEFVQNELDNGAYQARLVVLTRPGTQRGEPAFLAFEVADESPAVAAGNFAVELT